MGLFGFFKRRKEVKLQLKRAEELKIKQANCIHQWAYKSEWVCAGCDGASDEYVFREWYCCVKCGKVSASIRPE